MFSYERQLDNHAEPVTLSVPTALMRTGNFSEILATTPIYDPNTARCVNASGATVAAVNNACPTGANVTRTAFAGNIIPADRLNPAAVAFLKLYPLPNLPGTVQNYFSNQNLSRPYNSYLARIDHNFNDTNRIFGKFFYSKSNEDHYNFLGAPDSITQGFEIRTNKGGSLDYTSTLSSNLVLDVRTSFTPTINNGLTFTSNINNPFPGGLNPAIGSSLGLNTSLGTALGTTNASGPTDTTVYTYDRKNPNYTRFIAGVQRELPFNIGVEATFVLSRGSDLPVLRQLNFVLRQYLNDFTGVTDPATILNTITTTQTFLSAAVPNPFRGLVPQNATLNAPTIARRLLLTQFPQFQDLIVTEYNGSTDYRSLHLQATKRLSQGLPFNASYTYAHEREKTRRLNPQDEELANNISTFSRPHRVAFSGIFELPFGRKREYFSNLNPVVDAIFGGWQFNAVYEWQSGEPLVLPNVYYSGDPSTLKNLLGKSDYQGRRYGVDVSAISTNGFVFNVIDPRQLIGTAANANFNLSVVPGYGNNYTVSSQNTLRNLPYTLNNFRNQPFQKFDVGLTKNFNIRERMKLQVRIEAINAFNKVYLGNGLQLASSSSAFGFGSGQRNLPREIQIGARFTF